MSFLEEYLIKEGARKWKSNSITFPYSDYFYQVKVEDNLGIRYFIEFVHYSEVSMFTVIDTGTKNVIPECWMINVKFNYRESVSYELQIHLNSVNIINDYDVEKIYDRISGVWQALGRISYELQEEKE